MHTFGALHNSQSDMKQKLHTLLYNTPYLDRSILLLILLSVLGIILDTIPTVHTAIGNYIYTFDTFSVIIFTLEYILRLLVADISHPATTRWHSILRFMTSTYGLIDLMAILPFYLPLFFTIDLRFLRMIRLVRILRILKVNRYNNSMHLVGSVIKEKRYELLVTSFVALIVIIISTLLMYSLEGPEQSGAFPNLFAAFQWTLGTMASIGSNNLFPSTATGHVIGGIIGFFSIGLVALPTSIIGAGFIERVEQKKMQKQQYVVVKEKLMLLQELYDDGVISEEEHGEARGKLLNKLE